MRRAALLAALALLAVVALVGAGGALLARRQAEPRSPYTGNASLAQLRQLPETMLRYPGSAVIYELANETRGAGAQRNPSYAGFGLGTTAPASEVEDYYQQQLQARGWAPLGDTYRSRTSAELSTRSWRKGNLICRFAVLDQRSPLVGSDPRFPTIYEIRVRNLNRNDRAP